MTGPALSIDALGQRCPLPVIELARRIGDVGVGDVVEVLSDDPAAAADVPAWCRMRGHDYLGERPAPIGTVYLVRRAR
ncbi:MAG: cysteine desulfurase [Frankiaceae bacterium]|nr:cysteine desulfurase [Frankiaceae bacterium]